MGGVAANDSRAASAPPREAEKMLSERFGGWSILMEVGRKAAYKSACAVLPGF